MSEGSAAIFGVIAQRGLRLAMRDGTRLATDLYFPGRDGVVVPGRHPVLLERTPYSRQIASSVAAARFFARHGYVVALQDVRGRYDTEGEWYPFAREENDGFDTVEWLGTQEWSNGKVGTMACRTPAAINMRWPRWRRHICRRCSCPRECPTITPVRCGRAARWSCDS